MKQVYNELNGGTLKIHEAVEACNSYDWYLYAPLWDGSNQAKVMALELEIQQTYNDFHGNVTLLLLQSVLNFLIFFL